MVASFTPKSPQCCSLQAIWSVIHVQSTNGARWAMHQNLYKFDQIPKPLNMSNRHGEKKAVHPCCAYFVHLKKAVSNCVGRQTDTPISQGLLRFTCISGTWSFPKRHRQLTKDVDFHNQMVKISNTQIISFNNTPQPDRLVFNTQIQTLLCRWNDLMMKHSWGYIGNRLTDKSSNLQNCSIVQLKWQH